MIPSLEPLPPVRRVVLLTLGASAVFFGLLTAFGYWAFTPDDGLIHLTYIRNVAAGNGFVFSGGAPSYGETSPLWVLVHAGPAALSGNPLASMKVVSAALTILAIGGAVWLAWRAGGGACAVVAAAVVVTDPWLLRWAVSGLEVSLAAAVAVWTVIALAARRWRVAAALAGAAPLARPDFAPFTALVGFLLLWHSLRRDEPTSPDQPAARRPHWAAYVLILLPGLAWAAYAWRTFGTPIPNTVRAKSFSAGYDFWSAGRQTGEILAASHGLVVAAGLVALAACGRRVWDRWPPVGRVAAFALPVLLVGTYLMSRSATVSRYFMAATVPAQVIAVTALYLAWPRSAGRRVAVGVAAASCAACLFLSARQIAPWVAGYNDGFAKARALPAWLNEHAAPGDLVVASDIGYLGYYNRAGYVVVDSAGLVSPEMLVPRAERSRRLCDMRPRFVVLRFGTENVVAAGGEMWDLGFDPATTARAVRYVTSAELGRAGVSAGEAATYYTLYEIDWSKVGDALQPRGQQP